MGLRSREGALGFSWALGPWFVHVCFGCACLVFSGVVVAMVDCFVFKVGLAASLTTSLIDRIVIVVCWLG